MRESRIHHYITSATVYAMIQRYCHWAGFTIAASLSLATSVAHANNRGRNTPPPYATPGRAWYHCFHITPLIRYCWLPLLATTHADYATTHYWPLHTAITPLLPYYCFHTLRHWCRCHYHFIDWRLITPLFGHYAFRHTLLLLILLLICHCVFIIITPYILFSLIVCYAIISPSFHYITIMPYYAISHYHYYELRAFFSHITLPLLRHWLLLSTLHNIIYVITLVIGHFINISRHADYCHCHIITTFSLSFSCLLLRRLSYAIRFRLLRHYCILRHYYITINSLLFD